MELSRRSFLTGAAAGGAALAMGTLLSACAPEENTPTQVAGSSDDEEEEEEEETTEEETTEESTDTTEESTDESADTSTDTSTSTSTSTSTGSYVAGTYTATATGIGEVTVTVTFDETSITAVELDVSNETETIGQAAADELIEQVMAAQSSDIEGVSGATLTSTAVSEGVADCIAQAAASSTEESTEEAASSDGSTYNAGTYTATATGIGEVTVTVTFDETSITAVELDVSNETETIGQAAADELIEQVMAAQSSDIEGVSGATLTSTAVATGVADCISQAAVAGTSTEEESTEEESTSTETGERVTGYSGPGDWLGTAPEITDIAEEIDVDVVVVGSGHAGTQAALSAAEEGAVVAVIETQSEDVFTYYGEDIGAWNSQFAQDAGFPEYDLGEVTAEFITRSGGRCLPDIVRLYVQNSGATLDHMIEVSEEMGIDERCYTYDNTEDGYVIIQANMDYDKIEAGEDIYDCINYDNYPLNTGTKTWASCVQFMGEYNDEPIDGVAANSVLPEVEGACIAKAEELGATWYYGYTAIELVQDDSGAVTGVIVEADDGTYVQFNTSMGVVMCGGGYAGNADMCWALLNEYMERNERAGGSKDDFYSFMGGRDGSSVKMMCWAGGFIEPAPRGSMILGGGPSGPWGTNSMLWLNSDGERFTNEGLISAAQTACARQPAGIISCVTDAKWLQSVCNMGLEHGGPNGGRPQYYQDMIDGMNAIEVGPDGGQVMNCTIAERGYTTVYAADTLEDLAEYLGYEDDAIETFVESIEHYNELCEAGSDTDYGKNSSMMIAVDEPPYYGFTTTQSDSPSPSMVTMSGVMTDTRLNVLDGDHNPISGLYAAGNSLGGRYGLGYSTPCAGNSIGMAVTHGRLAGKFVTGAEEVDLNSTSSDEAEGEEEEASEGTYTAGTYTATATGMGTVTVTVTFDETSITEVELDVSEETATIGQAAADELIEQVLDAQSSDIEGVSGATLTSTAVATGVADCIEQATAGAASDEEEAEEEEAEEEEAAEEETEEEAEEEETEEEEEEAAEASGTYVAGTYTATATGIGEVTVTVTFDEDSIVEVELDVSNETETIGQAAADELIEQVLDAQSDDIEGVSGATLTSTAVSTGVADCIEQALA